MVKQFKTVSINLLLLTGLLQLVACSNEVPQIVGLTNEEQGLKLEVPMLAGWGQQAKVTMTLGDSIELQANMQNAQGRPVAEAELLVTSQLGNFFTQNNLLTDANGQAFTVFLATNPGEDIITLTNQIGVSVALAISVQEPVIDQMTLLNSQNIPKLQELPDVVSWKTLSQVTYVEDIKIPPEFSPEITALNGQEVKIQGFMMPLENKPRQQHFLISTSPPSCFYCLPAGPEGIIEVYTAGEGIEFSFEPIVLNGELQVLNDDEMGLFYRMQKAERISL